MGLLAAAVVLGLFGPPRPLQPKADRVTGGLAIGARTDLRDYSIPGEEPSLDSSTSVVVGGFLRSSRLSLRAVYAPSFFYQGLATPERRFYSLQQAGALGLSYIVPLKRLTLTFLVDGSMSWSAVPITPYVAPTAQPPQTPAGTMTPDMTGKPGLNAPATPIEAPVNTIGGKVLPYNVVATVGTLRGAASAIYFFTRRLSMLDALYVATAGGIGFTAEKNYEAQVLSPINRTLGASTSLNYALTRFDRISTSVTGGYTVVLPPPLRDGTKQPDSNSLIGTVLQSYGRAFSKRAIGSIGAGYSIATSKTQGQPEIIASSAAGDASFAYTNPLARDSTVTVRAGAHYGLAVDLYAGGAQPVASASGSATWAPRPFSFNLGVDFSSTVNSTPETQSITGSASIAYVPVPAVQFVAGASLLRVIYPNQTVLLANAVGPTPVVNSDSVQWAVFFAASVSAPVAAF